MPSRLPSEIPFTSNAADAAVRRGADGPWFGSGATAQSRPGDQVACDHVQAISVRLFAMSHKPRTRLPKTIAWSVWLSIQARKLARNAWLCAGLNTA